MALGSLHEQPDLTTLIPYDHTHPLPIRSEFKHVQTCVINDCGVVSLEYFLHRVYGVCIHVLKLKNVNFFISFNLDPKPHLNIPLKDGLFHFNRHNIVIITGINESYFGACFYQRLFIGTRRLIIQITGRIEKL